MPYHNDISRLQTIMAELRARCPWDKKQTIDTLRPLTIEETYELAGAITDGDWPGLKEELGDILLHLVFYSVIAQEGGHFSFADVVEGICNKLVARHPHIYAGTRVNDDDDVKRNWEQIKLQQGGGKKSLLAGVPQALPALVKALRLQEKTASVGFEWSEPAQVRVQLDEELRELDEAVQAGGQDAMEDELGDVFFTLVNYARFLKADPEAALERSNRKFKSRFEGMERLSAARGKTLHDMSLSEMEALWKEVKKGGQE